MASKCQHEHAESVVHREGINRWIYVRCPDCNREWQTVTTVADLDGVVTTDEIIEVHELLGTDKSISELIDR